ncbi:hypothetical protein DESC_970001 [Desulfosarcina cetonica]|uniref:PEP-CTERM sorting domain-containing protein n=1 Tax=Desulfosarcina cetonica TaxID=90730 RepID=UPI0006D24EB6|nr:PEP-CTERM sorting domain-containing protein [Desulfosarcina cetonica]VTR71510.1 hypothetical protein DESC_970001 [Desulfosarcina cetonica]
MKKVIVILYSLLLVLAMVGTSEAIKFNIIDGPSGYIEWFEEWDYPLYDLYRFGGVNMTIYLDGYDPIYAEDGYNELELVALDYANFYASAEAIVVGPEGDRFGNYWILSGSAYYSADYSSVTDGWGVYVNEYYLLDFDLLYFNEEDVRIASYHITAAPVPEPSTMFLFGSGLLGIVGASKRKRKKNNSLDLIYF